jgi:hypothetical protein
VPHFWTVFPLDGAEDQVLDNEPMMITVKQACEDGGYVEEVAVLEDEPAEPALARGHAEHQLGRDQRAPGESPADLEAGEDRAEGGGMRIFAT